MTDLDLQKEYRVHHASSNRDTVVISLLQDLEASVQIDDVQLPGFKIGRPEDRPPAITNGLLVKGYKGDRLIESLEKYLVYGKLSGSQSMRSWLKRVTTLPVMKTDQGLYRVIDGDGGYVTLSPFSAIKHILANLHKSNLATHYSYPVMLRAAQSNYSWPSMSSDVREYSSVCIDCQRYNSHQGRAKSSALPMAPIRPFQIIACIYAEMGKDKPSYPSGYRNTLVFVDCFSKFVILAPTRSTKTREAIQAMRDRLFPVCGIPEGIIVDQQSSLVGKEVKKAAREYGFQLIPVPPNAKDKNALAE